MRTESKLMSHHVVLPCRYIDLYDPCRNISPSLDHRTVDWFLPGGNHKQCIVDTSNIPTCILCTFPQQTPGGKSSSLYLSYTGSWGSQSHCNHRPTEERDKINVNCISPKNSCYLQPFVRHTWELLYSNIFVMSTAMHLYYSARQPAWAGEE